MQLVHIAYVNVHLVKISTTNGFWVIYKETLNLQALHMKSKEGILWSGGNPFELLTRDFSFFQSINSSYTQRLKHALP